MKIIFFTEINNHAGGMDSFLINTINNWPYKKDSIFLVCNNSHKGFKNIKIY